MALVRHKIPGGHGKRRFKPSRSGRTSLTPELVYNRLMDVFVGNATTLGGPPTSREDFMRSGLETKKGRDLDAECGYPKEDPDILDYEEMYQRGDIASNIVNAYPDACWETYPELYETEDPKITPFEKAWADLRKNPATDPWYHLHLADRLSGIGQFGIILLGFDDVGKDGVGMAHPVSGFIYPDGMSPKRSKGRPTAPRENKLLYMRPYSQTQVKIAKFDENSNSPRFGLPVFYDVSVADPSIGNNAHEPEPSRDLLVHWTRAWHVKDYGLSSPVFALPRMKQVYNRLLDIRKILGGSAEMFWKGGFPGFAFEVFPELAQAAVVNKQQLKDEMAAYQAGLQRFLSAVGGTWKSLAPQVADPSNHLQTQMLMVAATIKIPIPVLLGSQVGHLASEQNATDWMRRVGGRCNLYLGPQVIIPFGDHLQRCRCLPRTEQLLLAWRDKDTLTAKDRADVALKLTQALLQFVSSGGEKVMSVERYLITVWGMDPAEARVLADEAKASKQYVTKELWDTNVENTPANGPAKKPTKKTNAGGNRNGLGGKPKRRQLKGK